MTNSAPTAASPARPSRRSSNEPTIADVAREAGVSPMTVSRVVNGGTNVAAAKRALVEAAIERIGYVPNQAARALAGGQQCRIALLHDNPSAGWLSAVLVACLDQANRSNAQLLVEHAEDPEAVEQFVAHLLSHRIDGVILPPPLCDDARLRAALIAAGIRMVLVASGQPASDAIAVGIDDRQAAFDMTRHLIALGHRRIGFIAGNPNQTASRARLDGFRAALTGAGIAGPELIATGDFSFASGLDAAETLLSSADRPTAIFASNDDMAAATIAVANRRGLKVPENLTVCGFDDTAIASMVWPPLTTVRQPIGEMAASAASRLVDAIRAGSAGGHGAGAHMTLEHEIVERASAGIAPAAS